MNHIWLGEQLSNSWQFCTVNFITTGIDGSFGFALPKLIYPANGIIGNKYLVF
jgi:hypothetical protein